MGRFARGSNLHRRSATQRLREPQPETKRAWSVSICPEAALGPPTQHANHVDDQGEEDLFHGEICRAYALRIAHRKGGGGRERGQGEDWDGQDQDGCNGRVNLHRGGIARWRSRGGDGRVSVRLHAVPSPRLPSVPPPSTTTTTIKPSYPLVHAHMQPHKLTHIITCSLLAHSKTPTTTHLPIHLQHHHASGRPPPHLELACRARVEGGPHTRPTTRPHTRRVQPPATS